MEAGIQVAWTLRALMSYPFLTSDELTFPAADNMTAIKRVFGNLARTIAMITIMGTQRNIPSTPQIAPQNAKDSKITIGLKFKLAPIHFGSIRFPTTN